MDCQSFARVDVGPDNYKLNSSAKYGHASAASPATASAAQRIFASPSRHPDCSATSERKAVAFSATRKERYSAMVRTRAEPAATGVRRSSRLMGASRALSSRVRHCTEKSSSCKHIQERIKLLGSQSAEAQAASGRARGWARSQL